MAWNPSESVQVPQIFMQGMQGLDRGIQSLGQDLGEDIFKHLQEKKKLQEEQSFNDQVVSHALKPNPLTGKPTMSMEDKLKYDKASASAKNGIVHGLMVDMADDFKSQLAQEKLQNQMTIAGHQADAAAARNENSYLRTMLQYGPDKPMTVTPIKSPYTGAPVGVENPKGGTTMYSKETMTELAAQRKAIKDNILQRNAPGIVGGLTGHKQDRAIVFKDGQKGTVPIDQLDKAIEEGYR